MTHTCPTRRCTYLLMDGGSAQAASDLPRYHHQYLPDVISAEAGAFSNDEIQGLQAKGHNVTVESRTWGNMQVVVWNQETGAVEPGRSEEHTSELQSLMRITYAVL